MTTPLRSEAQPSPSLRPSYVNDLAADIATVRTVADTAAESLIFVGTSAPDPAVYPLWLDPS